MLVEKVTNSYEIHQLSALFHRNSTTSGQKLAWKGIRYQQNVN